MSQFAMKGKGVALIVVLGLATAFDAMAIDMYMPAFTAIQGALGISASLLQASFAVFLLGLAFGQTIFGFAIDRLGRRTPLLLGLIIFSISSVALSASTTAETFLIARFLQGFGGAAGLVIPRAIVADTYSLGESGRIFAVLMQITAIAPVIAPPLGGLILGILGWRAIFILLALVGVCVAFAALRYVPETLPKESRSNLSFKDELKAYGSLLRTSSFSRPMLSAVFITGSLFVYIAGSPFLFVDYLGFSPNEYSFILAFNALAMVCAGQLSIVMLKRLPENRVCRMGFYWHAASVLLLAVYYIYGGANKIALTALLLSCLASMAVIFGPLISQVMLSAPTSLRGAASALLGIMQYAFGAGMGILLGVLHDGSHRPIGILIAFCSLLAAAFWLKGAKKQRIPAFGSN